MNANASNPFENIVLSKLDIPIPARTSIERRPFLRALVDSCNEKLTCLVAESGYGKHTALAQLARILPRKEALDELGASPNQTIMKVAWLRVDERDNDEEHFWKHILSLLPDLPHSIDVSHPSYETLFPAINRRFKEHRLFVLSRLDKVSNPTILNTLMKLIADAPAELHFIFSAQTMPQCIKGKVYNLCPQWFTRKDFQYSRAETEEQLKAMLGDSFSYLTSSDIDSIHKITEGWATGVILAAQTAKNACSSGKAFAFSGSSPEVSLYFSSRMNAKVTDKLHSAATVLSLSERFNAELVDELFGEDEEGGKKGSFSSLFFSTDAFLLVPWEEDASWFRFNHLFCDWLHHEALKLRGTSLRDYCLRMGEWFLSFETTNESTKYLLMAQDFEFIEGMALSLTGLHRASKQNPIVWLASLDSEQFESSPLLCILSAWAHNSSGHVREALHWTDLFVTACTNSASTDLPPIPVDFTKQFMDIKCRAMVEGGADTYRECEEIIDSADDIAPSLLGTLYQTMGESKIQMGEFAEAEDFFLQAQACAYVDGTNHQLYFNMYFIAEMYYRLGRLDDLEKTCKQLLSNQKIPSVFKSATQALLGSSYTERMNQALAEPIIREARKGSSIFQNLDLFLTAEISWADYLLSTGNANEAYVTISEAVMRAERHIVPRGILLDAYYCQARIAMFRHNVRDLKILSKKFSFRLQPQDAIHHIQFLHVSAMLHKSEGDISLALQSFDETLDYASRNGFHLLKEKALIDKVACLYLKGESEQARHWLCKAVQQASTYGYPNSLIGMDRSIENALVSYSSSAQASPAIREFVKRALSKSATSRTSIQADGVARESGLSSLSSREKEVISLLKLGMSRQEISDALCVSINTTKKHLSSIYSKLGVATKTELLNLLPPK